MHLGQGRFHHLRLCISCPVLESPAGAAARWPAHRPSGRTAPAGMRAGLHPDVTAPGSGRPLILQLRHRRQHRLEGHTRIIHGRRVGDADELLVHHRVQRPVHQHADALPLSGHVQHRLRPPCLRLHSTASDSNRFMGSCRTPKWCWSPPRGLRRGEHPACARWTWCPAASEPAGHGVGRHAVPAHPPPGPPPDSRCSNACLQPSGRTSLREASVTIHGRASSAKDRKYSGLWSRHTSRCFEPQALQRAGPSDPAMKRPGE